MCSFISVSFSSYDLNELIKNIKNLKISGRLENIDLGQDFKVVVDYAHTPNGINNLLQFMNSLEHNKLIVVFLNQEKEIKVNDQVRAIMLLLTVIMRL